jgi:hypothetical protein
MGLLIGARGAGCCGTVKYGPWPAAINFFNWLGVIIPYDEEVEDGIMTGAEILADA